MADDRAFCTFLNRPECEMVFHIMGSLSGECRHAIYLAGEQSTADRVPTLLDGAFVEACVSGKLPPNHALVTAHHCVQGIATQESTNRERELGKMRDCGDPPAAWPTWCARWERG